jgi:hypothetical protein
VLGKLIIIILVVGATASALLVNRQKRIETFHEMSQIHRRLHNHEFNLWKLRMQIAGRCRPAQVRLLVDRMGIQWIPIPAPGSPLMSPATDVRLATHKKPADTKPKGPSGTPSKPKSNAKTSAKKPPVQVASNARNRNRPG